MDFSLINNEPLTKTIIENLQNFGFDRVEIDIRDCLTFITIKDNRYYSYITREIFEEEYQLVLHIFSSMFVKVENKNFLIPLKIIQTIDKLRLDY